MSVQSKPQTRPSIATMIKDMLALSHIVNGIGSGVGAAVGVIVTARYFGQNPPIWSVIGAALITLLISNGGFIINDIRDLPIDQVNRPDRPLPAGRISISTAYALYIGSTVLGLVIAALMGIPVLVMATVIAGLLYAYSQWLKSRYLVGHLAIATMGGLLFPFGGAVVGSVIPTIYIVPAVFLAFLGREILKTVPDVEGDRAFSVDNLATRHGVHAAGKVGRILIFVSAVLLPFVGLIWPMNAAYYVLIVALVVPMCALVVLSARAATLEQDQAMTNLLRLTKLLFLLVAVALLIGAR